MNTSTRTLYDKARRGLAEGDAGNWRAAEAMAALYNAGEIQSAIAAELGCSQRTVSNYVRVWAEHGRATPRLTFSEALGLIRGDYNQKKVPKSPEAQAELVAELIKKKEVYEAPVVKKAVDRHVDRQLKQAAAAANKANGIPTRTEKTRDQRRLSPVINRTFWRDLLYALEAATRLLNEASSELERTGLPEGQSGDIVRSTRSIAKAADRFAIAAAKKAIGDPIERGA